METVTIDSIKVGDIIECSCTQDCVKNYNCNLHCSTNPCQTLPKLEKVLSIIKQPSIHAVWFVLELTHSKVKYGWSTTLITRQI